MKKLLYIPQLALVAVLCLPGLKAKSQTAFPGYEYSAADAIYTTYAAPMARTDYRSDQAWELMWTDPSKPIGLESATGGRCGLMLTFGSKVINNLGVYASEPLISRSTSSGVRLHFKPVKSCNVEATFYVYSSHATILEYRFTNVSGLPIFFSAFPYYQRDQGIKQVSSDSSSFVFHYTQPRDAWMLEHNIPLAESFENRFCLNQPADNSGISDSLPAAKDMLSARLTGGTEQAQEQALVFLKHILLNPGETKSIRLILFSNQKEAEKKSRELFSLDLDKVLLEEEKLFEKVPALPSLIKLPADKQKQLTGLYGSAFRLMRQCMMPPEGECRTNYYVFSREPKWGWGYGGQVFHESLSMLAYVYLDPQGAMNSQRVFMERQQKDGYINYRTGPYLNEMIVTDSVRTSSAPWFSYVNYEIYKVTRDKVFLSQAYESGKKLYNWFARNRDRDGDGLFEWGGNGTLECVRDGLVATWDRVSKPENLEGPDLNSLMVKEAACLSEMAKILGKENEAKVWIEMARKHATRINKQLWDPATGFYYNTLLSTNGFTFLEKDDLKIKEITGFLPLWANLCSPEQAKILVQTLYNPEEFWRPYGIPTLSASDPYYNPMGYWNGPVWVQWQYLLFRGLADYGYKQVALQLGERITDQMIWHLKNDHTFWEFYSPDDRQAGWNHTYIWAGIVARMMMEIEDLK